MMMHEQLDSFSFLGARNDCTDGQQHVTSTGSTPKRQLVLHDFERKLAKKLDKLGKAGEERGFLSIDWLVNALLVVASTHANVQALIPNLTHEDDDKGVREYLDDSAKVLEVCNVLKRRIADVQVYRTSVQGAIRCLEGNDRSYYRARRALLDCTLGEESSDRELELESGMSMLRAMYEKVVEPEASGSGFFNVAIYGAKVITIFLCFLVVGALRSWCPLLRRSGMKMHVSKKYLWASSLFSIVQRGKEEISKRLPEFGVKALLYELETVVVLVHVLGRRLHGVVDESLIPLLGDHGAIEKSLNTSETKELRCLAVSLDARSKSLGRSLVSLDRCVNELSQLLDRRQLKCTALHDSLST